MANDFATMLGGGMPSLGMSQPAPNAQMSDIGQRLAALQAMMQQNGQGQGFGLGQTLPGMQPSGSPLMSPGVMASALGASNPTAGIGQGGMAHALLQLGPMLSNMAQNQQQPQIQPGALPIANAMRMPGMARGYMAPNGGVQPRRVVGSLGM